MPREPRYDFRLAKRFFRQIKRLADFAEIRLHHKHGTLVGGLTVQEQLKTYLNQRAANNFLNLSALELKHILPCN